MRENSVHTFAFLWAAILCCLLHAIQDQAFSRQGQYPWSDISKRGAINAAQDRFMANSMVAQSPQKVEVGANGGL